MAGDFLTGVLVGAGAIVGAIGVIGSVLVFLLVGGAAWTLFTDRMARRYALHFVGVHTRLSNTSCCWYCEKAMEASGD